MIIIWLSDLLWRMDREIRARMEAALFAAGRPLPIGTLKRIGKAPTLREAREIMEGLVREYKERDGGIEIIQLEGERYIMQIKPEYSEAVRRISVRPLVSRGALKTLTAIALNQPIAQSDVIKMRGRGAYEHVRELVRYGLVKAEKVGRTLRLTTTPLFAEIFKLSKDISYAKRQLRRRMENSE